MIKYLEKSGRTMEDAIAAALAELGRSEEEISVEVLERAKSGFLGIGAQPALIRVSYEVPDEPAAEKKEAPAPKKAEKKPEAKKAEEKKPEAKKTEEKKPAPKKEAPAPVDEDAEFAAVRAFISGLMERMGVEAEIEISRRDNGGINVKLSGSGMGAIIGRRGETLDAIQHLTNYVVVVNRDSDKHMHISVDAENYRAKREESLTKLAEKMAEKAIKYKRSMALEPMNSYERHVIHTALQNYEGVTTSSTGVEPNRRVVVSYVRPEPSDNKPQSREWA